MDLPAGGRFEIVRRLGAGGMGVVYEAIDRSSGMRVALKTLANLDAAALYRFKKEFRALADLAHPNLVRLHELVAHPAGCFFTMELIAGVELLDYVAPRTPPVTHDSQPIGEVSTVDGWHPATSSVEAVAPAEPSSRREVDLPRLRAALPQLVLGLDALHAAGKLHRDVKPSNVMVTAAGRLVLLDFGIVADVREQKATDVNLVVGTPMYMSPEQAASMELSPATDWYAVGVVLYEALTGRLPFVGAPIRVLMDKQRMQPPPPQQVAEGVPDDLNDLCVALLRTRAEDRPSGAEILRRLGIDREQAVSAVQDTWKTAAAPFIGRDGLLGTLAEAFESSRQGESEVVFVRGESGMGKTTFVRHFLDQVAADAGALVFAGRCYERESVPYKAFDAIIDALSRHLRGLSGAEAAALMPKFPGILPRLFPVLGRVSAIADGAHGAATFDLHQLRVRAFSALREMLTRIAERRSLILFVDDLQWADADSAALFAELTSPPDPPPMLMILGHRREDEERSEVLRQILRPSAGAVRARPPRTINLEALTEGEARRCAAMLVNAPENDEIVGIIARESEGNPFFLGELGRYVRAKSTRASMSRLFLAKVLGDRTEDLTVEARRLLEIIAVAGRPIREEIAVQAAELAPDAGALAIRSLRAGHFVRSASVATERSVEAFHDKVRETVLGRIGPAELRAHHRALVEAMRAGGETDAERMFVHARAAEMREAAATFARAAAERAVQLLAFDRAAELFQAAIEFAERGDEGLVKLHVSLGAALSSAGRGAKAAEQFLLAADLGDAGDGLELRRRAAECLLHSGEMERGLVVVREVLERVGLRLDASPLSALVRLLALRIWLLVRGTGFRPKTASQVPPDELTRVDVCWSIAAGLSVVDTIRGNLFSARHAVRALRSGEVHRVARALAFEAAFVSFSGLRARRRARALEAKATALLASTKDAETRGYVLGFGGLVDFFGGQWRAAVSKLDEATEILEPWRLALESDNSRLIAIWALTFLGELSDGTQRLAPALRDADGRGDLYPRTAMRVGKVTHIWLAGGDVPATRAAVAEAMSLWPRTSFLTPHFWELESISMIAAYEGRGAEAHDAWTARWPALERSLLLRIQVTRHMAYFHRAGSALLAATAANRADHERRVLRDAQRILRDETPWSAPLAHLLQAGVHAHRKDDVRAVASLERAVALFTAADMTLYAAAGKRRLGAMIQGDRGRQLLDEGTTHMRQERVKDVERMTAMMTPGFAR